MKNSVDLREHARLSLRFLAGAVNPKRRHLPYFWIDFLPEPPQFAHEMAFEDAENIGRWLYGIACAQRVAGCRDAEETRISILNEIDRRIAGPYGFMYTTEYTTERTGKAPYSWLWGNRSVLEGWIQCWRSAESEEERGQLAGRIERMVAGLEAFSIRKNQYVFFPTYKPPLDYKKPEDMRIPDETDYSAWHQFYADGKPTKPGYLPLPSDSLGGMIWPLVEWYELTGNQKALRLAEGISNTVVQYHPMRSNPICPVGCFSNNHGVLNAMAGVLACNRHIPNNRHLIWAETLFEYYLNRCSSSFGWVMENEQVSSERPVERPSSEGCAVVDMVRVGIELGRSGFPHGWDVAERFTRNYLTQAQIRSVKPFKVPADTVVNHEGRTAVMEVPAEHRESERFWQRVIGALSGWGAPNDILNPRGRIGMCIQNCCGSHLPIGLMHVWEHIATQNGDTINVNLLLSHDGPVCRTVDHQPETGMIEIFPKIFSKVVVRIPDWVEDEKIKVTINDSPVFYTWQSRSRYLQIAGTKPDNVVKVEYPLRQCSITERLGGTSYTTRWRGDTVLSIAPAGQFIPMFSDGLSENSSDRTKS